MSQTAADAPARSAREQFDRQAAHYDTQWSAWSEESLAWLRDHARPQPTDAALDVATGTGFTALAFAPLVRSVVGLDVSAGMLEQARARAEEQGITNATFQQGAAEALPFADGAFDLVLCRIAPHHFLDIGRFLAETARVLRPGGTFALSDTAVPDASPEAAAWQNRVEAVRDPSHVRNHTPSEWRRMTEGAGLRVSALDSAGGGITIPLGDWLLKAGCTPEQSAEVRRLFAEAPESARQAFRITPQPGGDTVFTWQRVVLTATKGQPAGQ
jgi:ubiquinone/menaquinone biosynthesis C-methylase UbiE